MDKKTLVENAVDKVLNKVAADEAGAAALNSTGTLNPNLEQYVDSEIKKEIELETKYGDRPLEAAAGSALSSATLGISDQLLTRAGVDQERLREVRERAPIPSGLGTATGIIAPAILTGGESLVAKGIGEAAVGARAAARAGAATEEVVASLLKDRVRSQAAKTIIQNAAQGAAEGAVYGVGDLVSENALGKADLNAENFVASAGAGALLGTGFGGALGGLKATVPLIRRGIAPIGEKLSSAAKNIVDPERAASELAGIKPSQMDKIHQYNPTFSADLPGYYVNKLELATLKSPEDLIAANRSVRKAAGAEIGRISGELDAATAANPEILPSRAQTYDRLLAKLRPLKEKLQLSPSVNKPQLDIIENFQDDLIKAGTKSRPPSFAELDELRKTYQGIKFKGGGAVESFKADVAETLRHELRNVVNEAAVNVSGFGTEPGIKNLADALKVANKDYSMSSTLERYLPKTLNKKALINLQDVVEGSVIGGVTGSGPLGIAAAAARKFGKSDLRRRWTILADLKTQNMAIADGIKKSIGIFVNKARPAARQLSLKTLVNSGFSVDYDTGKAAKTRKEALRNVAENVLHLQSDPDSLLKKLAASTARVGQAAPNIAQEAQITLTRAVGFLRSKLPSEPNQTMMFRRPYEPSDMELAKFERYMQAVEHPLSTLEDLERGTLTREHVEALQAVYPQIYETIRQEAIDQASQDQSLSYSKKVQLSTLLGVPTDESLEPYAIAALQSNFVAQNQAVEAPSPTNASALDISSRAQSGTEKIANRS